MKHTREDSKLQAIRSFARNCDTRKEFFEGCAGDGLSPVDISNAMGGVLAEQYSEFIG